MRKAKAANSISKPWLVGFTLIFIATGGYLIINSFAATPVTETATPSPTQSFGDWKWDAKSASLDPASSTLITNWLTYAVANPNLATNNWAVATAEAKTTDPSYSITLTDQGGTITVRIPLGTKPDPSGDGHLTVRDVARGTETDFWQAVYDPASQRISSASAAVTYPINSVNENSSGWGGNAANTPLRRGLVTPEMIAGTGEVNETLQFGNPKIGGTTSTFRYPALHNAPTSDIRPDNTHLVEGTWMRLDPSLNVDSLGLPAWQAKVAKGLQNYGMILRDNSGSLSVYGENPINRGGSALWANAGLSTSGSAGFSSNFPWDKMQVLNPPNTTISASKPGDTNNDNVVNITDLSTLLSHYSTNYPAADFNKDNIVNITDLSILLTNYGTSGTPADPVPVGVSGTWKLKFNDEFSGSSLDVTKWRPNWLAGSDTQITKPVNDMELSCYDPSQVSVGGGVLSLSAAARSCSANNGVTYNYASGLIESNNHYTFTYGYMEARMNLPGNNGTPTNWPAFWANGTGAWPTTGELDIMEVLGGTQPICWHFHYTNGAPGGCNTLSPANSGWHNFGAEWEPGKITYYYDGIQVGQVTSGVTSSPMYLVANMGVSNQIGGPIQVPAKTEIDYIRVWQHQ